VTWVSGIWRPTPRGRPRKGSTRGQAHEKSSDVSLPASACSALSYGRARTSSPTTTYECCSRAEYLQREPNTVRQVWVYTLGNDFAVEDPTLAVPPGEYRPIYFFNGSFVYKRTLVGI
jgi:hypothetical protein